MLVGTYIYKYSIKVISVVLGVLKKKKKLAVVLLTLDNMILF